MHLKLNLHIKVFKDWINTNIDSNVLQHILFYFSNWVAYLITTYTFFLQFPFIFQRNKTFPSPGVSHVPTSNWTLTSPAWAPLSMCDAQLSVLMLLCSYPPAILTPLIHLLSEPWRQRAPGCTDCSAERPSRCSRRKAFKTVERDFYYRHGSLNRRKKKKPLQV